MIKGVRGLWTLFATPTSIQTIYKEVIERAYIVLTYLTSIEGFVFHIYSIYNPFTVPMHCAFLVYAKHILLHVGGLQTHFYCAEVSGETTSDTYTREVFCCLL